MNNLVKSSKSYSSSNPLKNLQTEMDRMFDNFYRNFGIGESFGKKAEDLISSTQFNLPNLDISESDSEYYIHAELPGVAEKDIDVTIDKGILIIG